MTARTLRPQGFPSGETIAWLVLGAAAVASIGLSLHLTRGTTFYVDEVTFFQTSDGFAPRGLLAPFNGHLIAIPRAVYAISFSLFGPSYLPIRLLQAVGIALVAVLFYVLASRRIGPLALVPAVILLFFGSSWDTTLTPIGFPLVWSIAAGLGALIPLEAHTRRGDICACLLLVATVATHSTGLPYVAAGLVAVLIARNRWRRIWIVAIPAVLYAGWVLAKPSLDGSFPGLQSNPEPGNIFEAPSFFWNSASALASALAGLNYDSSAMLVPSNTDPVWGGVLAVIGLAAVAFRIARGKLSRDIWVAVALLGAVWLGYTLVSSAGRTPEASRYLFAGAVALLLVASEAAAGLKLNRFAVAGVLAVAAFSLVINVAHLRQGSHWLRAYSTNARAQFTAIDLARGRVAPNFGLSSGYAFYMGIVPGFYLDAAHRIGSPGFTTAELRSQSEFDRQSADNTLAGAIGVRLVPDPRGAATGPCRALPGAGGDAAVTFSAVPPGAVLRSRTAAAVVAGRFGAPSFPVGELPAGTPRVLRLPRDRYSEPWTISLSPPPSGGSICEPRR